jgi:Sigma-70 region 2.
MTELGQGPEAFESVAKPFLPLLWRCARRLMRTGHEAEDLVQIAAEAARLGGVRCRGRTTRLCAH